MALAEFDNINQNITLTEYEILEELRDYFEPMEITNKQKDERVDTAHELFNVLLFFFALVNTQVEYNQLEKTYLMDKLREDMSEVAFEKLKADDYVTEYLDKIVEDITVVTLAHLDAITSDLIEPTDDLNGKGNNYYTSSERALLIAENEANSIMNYAELQQALEQGYTQKEWVTMRDKRVRKKHSQVDGTIIPITEMFTVGSGQMMMPHDEVNNPSECVNCRCSLKYHG